MTTPVLTAWLTAAAVSALVWLSLPPPASTLGQVGSRYRRGPGPRWWGAGAVLAGAWVALTHGQTLVLALVLLSGVAGATRLVGAAARRREAGRRADRVVGLCEALADELRAGRPPSEALRHAAAEWDDLAPAASAAVLGGDVPGVLRRLAREPGAGGLREVASAWEVSSRSGATMARALGRTAETARLRRATQRLVASELASAQATARLVAALPFGLLLLGSGIGGDPWSFLVHTSVGLGCLAMGLALTLLGLWWIEHIAEAVVRE